MNIVDRFNKYNDPECWQYKIRENNQVSDLIESNLTKEDVANLQISDFTFHHIPKDDKENVKLVKAFIEKHEWLGKMSIYPTHFFVAKYKNIMAGVVVMDMPNAFSKLLGEKTKKMERLISRGACISWSPKNLASALIMFSIKWMVKNSRYRIFTAYSDPEAKELGTIYQACNFIYLGQNSGGSKQYKINEKWVSDRYFRSRSVYKRLAIENNITWDPIWQDGEKIFWDKMPPDIENRIREYSRDFISSCA